MLIYLTLTIHDYLPLFHLFSSLLKNPSGSAYLPYLRMHFPSRYPIILFGSPTGLFHVPIGNSVTDLTSDIELCLVFWPPIPASPFCKVCHLLPLYGSPLSVCQYYILDQSLGYRSDFKNHYSNIEGGGAQTLSSWSVCMEFSCCLPLTSLYQWNPWVILSAAG